MCIYVYMYICIYICAIRVWNQKSVVEVCIYMHILSIINKVRSESNMVEQFSGWHQSNTLLKQIEAASDVPSGGSPPYKPPRATTTWLTHPSCSNS